MAAARHFEELDCWQLANELKLEVYRLLESVRCKADIKFSDQLRDAVASAPRNIAEGFGRRSDADFARFLNVARGSSNECQNHLYDARDCEYIDEAERVRLDNLAKRALGAVAGLQRYLRRPKPRRRVER